MTNDTYVTPENPDGSSRMYKESFDPDASHSNPPSFSSNGAINDTRALEPMPLLERYQTALRHIHTVESHNAKLYQDNCRLVSAVNQLNERLAFLGAPQNIQMHRLTELQETLRASEANRALINRKYQELLQSVSAGSGQYHISAQLPAAREAYASLERDHRLLRDKYLRLKAVIDANRVAPTRNPVPIVHPDFRARDQSTVPSASIIPPEQSGHRRRRSSAGIIAQHTVRPGATPVATTRLAPLPTPQSSTSLAAGQLLPPGLPVQTPALAGSFPLPHHAQMNYQPYDPSGSPIVVPSQRPSEPDTSEQVGIAAHLRRRSNEPAMKSEEAPCSMRVSPTPFAASPRPPKRPSTELQIMTSPEGENKKPRIERVADCPPTIDTDTPPAIEMRSSPTSTDPSNDHKLPTSDLDARPYQDCVDAIFEKDADVENGVFCGLCYDRYEAKMIQEPPDVLVQPDFNFLVTHCKTMHPTAWADLCRKT